jgi:hypothetical protein
MHHPAAALTWELWRRHRMRLMTIVGLVLGFALVYPKLCALAGLSLDNQDPLNEIAKWIASGQDGQVLRVIQCVYLLFLACGPVATMFLTLLYVTWMFTFTENNPRTKDPMQFPARLFALPVSTSFLFGWLLAAGMTTIVILYGSWVYFVRLPHLEMFKVYQNCFGWMTLLALMQGIVWALAAWPFTRMLLLMVVFFGFTCSPARRDIFESPFVLPSFFVAGVVLARAGLQKMRHGQWQGWPWQWPLAALSARGEMRGPKRFASPAQAQLWFEWRRVGRRLCLIVAALAVVPVIIHLLVRVVGRLGPLEGDTLSGFAGCLVAIPLFIHFCFAISPAKADLSFLMIRPLTNGSMMMAALKAAVISTLISWAVVFATFCALPLLGDFNEVEQHLFPLRQFRPLVLLGFLLLTWRLIAVNLCCTWSGKRWLANVPSLMLVVGYAGILTVSLLNENIAYWNAFVRYVPALLVGLVVVKFLTAFLAFRISLQRRLLAPSALAAYLAIWSLLVIAFLTVAILSHPPKEWIFSVSLAIVLLMPLARIGFCPIALSWNRHG